MHTITRIAAIFGLAVLLVTTAGSAQTLPNPVDCTKWETNSEYPGCANACGDGIDNDGDCYVDKLPAGTSGFPLCAGGVALGPAPGCMLEINGKAVRGSTTYYFNTCTDNYDNDGDGNADKIAYGTPIANGISQGPETSCLIETNFGYYNACTDGINNDGDQSDNTAGGTTWTQLTDSGATVPPGAVADPECLGEVLCTDGIDNDGDGRIDNNAIDVPAGNLGPDSDCLCMTAASGQVNCTANDFTIAFTAAPSEIADGCINSTDSVTMTSFRATVTAHQPSRYDLGLWINLNGTNAETGGLCMRQMLTPVKLNYIYPAPPQVIGGNTDPLAPYYPTLETVGNSDQCGEVGKNYIADYEYPMPVTIKCSDLGLINPAIGSATVNGFVDLGQCGSWDNNQQDSYCGSITNALPNNAAKCLCQSNDTTVPAPNLLTTCSGTSGWVPTWPVDPNNNKQLDTGDIVQYNLAFTNTVTGCAPATFDPATDPFGSKRCGTVSFMRFAIYYARTGIDAGARGEFYVTNGTTNTPIPSCGNPVSSWEAVPAYSGLTTNGVVCNDTINKRLIWAPEDPTLNAGGTTHIGAYGVVPALAASTTWTLPFRYKLTSSGTGTGQFIAKILWDTTLETSPANGIISQAEALTVSRYSKEQNTCTDCGCTSSFSTTPVTLTSFAADREGSRIVFDWSTATEVGNVGFNLMGETADGWVRLNDELIPAASGDALGTQDYSVVLSVPGEIQRFAIEDVDIKDRAKRHDAADFAATVKGQLAEMAIPNNEIRREHESLKAERQDRFRKGFRTPSVVAASATSVGFGKAAVKKNPAIDLTVRRDGLYRVTFEDLLAAGFDLTGVQTARVGLSNRGVAVPIYVSAGKTLAAGAYFEFYGRALDTLYTNENVYRLELDVNKPARAAVDTAPPPGTPAAYYLETRTFEYNRAYAFQSPTEDPWYDTQMLVTTKPAEWRFPFAIDGLAAGAATARLSVRLFGGYDAPLDPDHHVILKLNGTTLGEWFGDGLTELPIAVDVPTGVLREGDNELIVRLAGDLGGKYDVVFLDRWSVAYPRAFNATAGALSFSAQGASFQIGGFTSAKVVAYRTSGSALTYLAGTSVTPAGTGFTASIPGGSNASYLVSGDNAVLTPAIAAARPYVDLTSGGAQYLIISHPDFIDGLAPLVSARQAQGLRVRVVDVEDIYAQFSGGILDPTAIRTYIAQAAATMATEYVLLVGGDSYDYRNFTGAASLSFIPSLYTATGDIVRFAPTDPSYADLDQDGTPDLAIGRLPVRTQAELATVIGKILAYQGKDYGSTAVFAADRLDAAANVPFAVASDTLAAKLPAGWNVQRAYLDQVGIAQARSSLLGAINNGVALANYVGHSAATTWTFNGLFTVADADALTNTGRPAVVTQWGCWNTYYVNPKSESLATRLLLGGNRGAVAVLGATTLTNDTDENDLSLLLGDRIARPGMTLGKAILEAKQALTGDKAARADVLLGWVLLGDPALVIQP